MKINVDIAKRLDWLEKRIIVSYVEREYIELQMKELAREVVKNLTIPAVSQRSELFNNFSEWYGTLSDHERDEFSTVGALEHYLFKIIK